MSIAAFLYACELHDAEGIAAVLDGGFDPRAPFNGQTPVAWLLEMYTRSDRLPACLRVLLDRGGELPDPLLAPLLLDDAPALAAALAADVRLQAHRTSLPSAFTPLEDVTLLHVAAEFGHLAAVQALLAAGADVDARAGVDGDGLGGQTPIFHAVNSHANRSAPVMHALLAAGSDPAARVEGLVWGRGQAWESTFFDLTPLAYAQLGTLPQMHRDPLDIDANVRALLAAARRPVPPMRNVPNRYLTRDA